MKVEVITKEKKDKKKKEKKKFKIWEKIFLSSILLFILLFNGAGIVIIETIYNRKNRF